MFTMSMGIMNGEIRFGPRSISTRCCSAVVCSPPMPEPMNTPISSRSTLSSSMPGVHQGLIAGVNAELGEAVGALEFLGGGKGGAGLKSFTSAAIWQSKGGGVKGGDLSDAALAGQQIGSRTCPLAAPARKPPPGR